MNDLQQRFLSQRFSNGYDFVDGVAMNLENPDFFRIPPEIIKRHVGQNQFVEVRIDSPRFSVHEDSEEKCQCPSCQGDLSKPILRHDQPASLWPHPRQVVPSRGWGEDFWVRITERDGDFFQAIVDNPLVEVRLHGLNLGDEVYFHSNQILAVHDRHRSELVSKMSIPELKELAELAEWLSKIKFQ
jgi:hypothetical protein